MGITQVNASTRLVDESIITSKIAPSAITRPKIVDNAIDNNKLDNADSYIVHQLESSTLIRAIESIISNGNAQIGTDLVVGKSINAAGGAFQVDETGTITVNSTKLKIDSATGDIISEGRLTFSGSATVMDSVTVTSQDKNFVLNKGGNSTSMTGAGLTIDNINGINGSIIFDSSSASKWKVGLEGSEHSIVDVVSVQTLDNKVYTLSSPVVYDGNTYTDIASLVRAIAAFCVDPYNNDYGDTSSNNYDTSTNSWTLSNVMRPGTSSKVKVYVQGLRLVPSTSSVSQESDYYVDEGANKIIFSRPLALGTNIVIDYL